MTIPPALFRTRARLLTHDPPFDPFFSLADGQVQRRRDDQQELQLLVRPLERACEWPQGLSGQGQVCVGLAILP
jgi:hypothetical protein